MRKAVLTVLMLVVGTSLAAAMYQIRHSVLGTGGGRMGSGTYEIIGTVGQAGVGSISSISYRAYIGYYVPGEFIPTAVAEEQLPIPTVFQLEQNRPNPFNPRTTIRFALPQASHVSLTVWNTSGHKVVTLADRKFKPGIHEVVFEARDLPSGVYFYKIEAGSYTSTRKLVLLK